MRGRWDPAKNDVPVSCVGAYRKDHCHQKGGASMTSGS